MVRTAAVSTMAWHSIDSCPAVAPGNSQGAFAVTLVVHGFRLNLTLVFVYPTAHWHWQV